MRVSITFNPKHPVILWELGCEGVSSKHLTAGMATGDRETSGVLTRHSSQADTPVQP